MATEVAEEEEDRWWKRMRQLNSRRSREMNGCGKEKIEERV